MPGMLKVGNHSKMSAIIVISKSPKWSEQHRNQDLPNTLFLVDPNNLVYIRGVLPSLLVSPLLPGALQPTHLGQLVLSQDSPSLLVLGLSGKETRMSWENGCCGLPLVLPSQKYEKRRVSQMVFLRERREWLPCNQTGGRGGNDWWFWDGDIPIHRELEKLSSLGSEKPASILWRLFEGIELCSERFVSRESGVAVGPPSSPHLGKLLLGDGASSHPTTVHPRGPPRCRDPGSPRPGIRHRLPDTEARVIRHLRATEFTSRFPAAGVRSPTARGQAAPPLAPGRSCKTVAECSYPSVLLGSS